MYKQIADYGLIRDIHSIALVSNADSIDYCIMPLIHAPTVFLSLLDDERGRGFNICPRLDFDHSQNYLSDTDIFSTEFNIFAGIAVSLDFISVENKKFYRKEDVIHRFLEIISGKVDFILELNPNLQSVWMIPNVTQNDAFFQFFA